ncbi:SGNH/GDSL hydrolase family protein, partial [Vibrio penaeicida]
MHPLQNGSQVTERPANKPVSGLPGYFTESGENNVPSYPGADWFNHVIDEFLNVLSLMGIQ